MLSCSVKPLTPADQVEVLFAQRPRSEHLHGHGVDVDSLHQHPAEGGTEEVAIQHVDGNAKGLGKTRETTLQTWEPGSASSICEQSLTLSLPRVIKLKFPLEPHQGYDITQYGELGFSQLTQMKDDYTTNSHYMTHTLLFQREWVLFYPVSEREFFAFV